MALVASTRAAFSGLPASSEIVRATSSWRLPRAPATLTRISARLWAGKGSAIAFSAASIAALASSAPAFATRPTTSPEYGERTSSQSPVSTHSPPIRSFRSVAVVAIVEAYAAGDTLRQERRPEHRLPGGRGGRARSHLCPGLDLQRRAHVGRARARARARSPCELLPADPVRQARNRPIGPGAARRATDARRADGRRASGSRRRRYRAGRVVRLLGGWAHECVVRSHLSRSDHGPCPLRRLREEDLEPGLSVGSETGGAGARDRRAREELVAHDGPRQARAK